MQTVDFTNQKIAEILLRKQILTLEEIKELLEESAKTKKTLEELIVTNRGMTQEKHQRCLSIIHEWQFATLHRENTDASALSGAAPNQIKEANVWQELQQLIELHSKEALFSKANESAILKIIDFLLREGCAQGASDIHIEPEREYAIVRFRIDGVMHDTVTLPPPIYSMILPSLKIMAKLRTDEHQIPQDGKIQYNFHGTIVDIRISILPTIKGENAVMRILSSSTRNFTLESLGLTKKDYEKFYQHVKKPWGMILVTGPTGSGKTTSLYAVLQILNRRDLNIITIEDPVEYYIEGITQIQVNQRAGLTFAGGLRSIVRQDPNIVMVGEIRDEETADIAINAGMTGHLVLSTLHTNDSPTAIPRLMEMKVKPFLVASTVNVIMAQRLVRKICKDCTMPYDSKFSDIQAMIPDIDLAKLLPLTTGANGGQPQDSIRLFRGQGCATCKKSGYLGRIGIFEVLEITDEIRALIVKNTDANSIREQARKQGMTTMFEDALEKALAGMTTLEDIIRVIK